MLKKCSINVTLNIPRTVQLDIKLRTVLYKINGVRNREAKQARLVWKSKTYVTREEEVEDCRGGVHLIGVSKITLDSYPYE